MVDPDLKSLCYCNFYRWGLGMIAFRLLKDDVVLPEPVARGKDTPDYARIVAQSTRFGATRVPAKLAALVGTLLSVDVGAREDAAYAHDALRRIMAELPPQERLARAREALEMGNWAETKVRCLGLFRRDCCSRCVLLALRDSRLDSMDRVSSSGPVLEHPG